MRTKSTNSAIFPILFGFFVMGFVDVVGIATNYVKMDFGLSDTLANLLPMMVFLWFALFSVPTGIWMGRHGRRNTVVVALAITTLAMLIPLFFYDFACILFAFALLGIGNTILQVSLNPMVARVVNPDKVTSVLTLGQFIKAVSSFLGPIIAGIASSFWGDWKLIFIVYSVTTLSSIIWLITTIPGKEEGEGQEASFASTLALCKDARIRMLFLGILCIVGIDVGLNTTIPKLLMEKLSMPLQEAGLGSSLYFAARTGGSFLGAILLARISSRPFLRGSMLIAILAFVGLLMGHGRYDRTGWLGLLECVFDPVLFCVGTSAGAIERGLGLDDYGCIRRRFDYALYGRHSRYVRTGSRLDAIINMYVVYRTYINKNTIR